MSKSVSKMKNNNTKTSKDWGIVQKKDSKGDLVWYARIVRTLPDGSKKQYTAKADNKSHAKRLRDELAAKFETNGVKAIDGDKMLFRELAANYKERKLIPAKYHQNRKVAGLRSLRMPLIFLETLLKHFSSKRIRDISPADLETFKQKRLDEPVITTRKNGEMSSRPRAIASVNRELALLRTILNDAVQNGWLLRSPFAGIKGVISLADEVKRERVLTYAEEKRLLEACGEREFTYTRKGKQITARDSKPDRFYLKAIIVCAIDTAMRQGELLKLRWNDVDFNSRMITIQAMNTKTARERAVGMTVDVFDVLTRLWESSPKDRNGLVFGIKDNFKRSFSSACKAAEIIDFRFHDLRHTAITRMIEAGLSPMEIMKISGHTQMTTFARYVNPNATAVNRIADTLAAHKARANAQNLNNDFLN